jgi:hypothetical protein
VRIQLTWLGGLGGLLLLAAGCASPLPPPGAQSAWRVGPLLEGARLESGDRLLAVRPLYSRETAGDEPFRRVTDILWPLGTFSRRDDRLSWRCLLFYGTGDAAPASNGAYRFRLFPIYYQGRTRTGDAYAALFPLYGEIQDFLGFGEVHFALFPLYGTALAQETRTRTVLWPFYLTRHGPDIDQFRLWPFYGERRASGRYAHTRHFVLWPLWSDIHMESEAIRGDGFVLFPLYGRSHFDRPDRGPEEGWTLLPPFFSSVRGADGYRSLRAPWPFVRQLDDRGRRERHWWPLYGGTTNALRRDWYAVWPLVSGSVEARPRETVRQFAVSPLFFRERRTGRPAAPGGPPRVTDAYDRLWPLFSWQRNAHGSQLRIPELTLFRRSAPIERNWAPFWSLFVRRQRADGARVTDLLWGLAAWGRDERQRGFVQLLWAFRFSGSGGGDGARGGSPAAEEEQQQP